MGFEITVKEKNEECEACMKNLQVKQVTVDEKQKVVSARRMVIEAEEREIQILADIALADLQEAMPALEAAMAVCCLFYTVHCCKVLTARVVSTLPKASIEPCKELGEHYSVHNVTQLTRSTYAMSNALYIPRL